MNFPRGSIFGLPPGGDLDPQTGFAEQTSWAREAPPAAEIFAALYSHLCSAAQRAHPGDIFIGIAGPDRQLVTSTVARPGSRIVIGRHSQCRLRLTENRISLRHMALLVGQPSSSGRPALRAWDLRTTRPFVTEDGVPTEAVASEGAFFASVGPYGLAMIPLLPPAMLEWPASASEAFTALPRREFVNRLAGGTGPERSFAADPYRSRVTHLGSTCGVDELDDPQAAVAHITVKSNAGKRRYFVAPHHLERGILLGRYGRCLSHVIQDGSVSRVHLLIASAGRHVYAVDTASTTGSFIAGAECEAEPLDDRATIHLGTDTVVKWVAKNIARA